ncbi:TetR/AcrR family transcriptional regulator [Streptomyces sp. NPDC097107]|uniref:TetR/AcrR family transcriptional regulator n=1 Tax=Streptomyces sp. NPDC097107 TaxID=3366089 RepID=UPI0037F4F5D6
MKELTMAAGTSAPRTRRDKERNRSHILEIAQEFFSEEGVSGSLDTIAKRAGVGPGTLYRHFPTREALIAALLQARYDELFDRRDAIERDERDTARALEQWLEALYDYATAFDGLPDPLRDALLEESSPLATTCENFITATDAFLVAAQQDHRAQPWVRGRDLFLDVLATAWVRGAALADDSSATVLRAVHKSGWMIPTP